MYYDDVFAVFGPIEDQQDQVAGVLSSKSLEPKSMIQQAFRCAMTTKPHIQSAITEAQFFDFAFFSGFANGSAIPSRPVIESEQRLNAPIGGSDFNPSTRTPTPGGSNATAASSGGGLAKPSRMFCQLGRVELHRVFDICVRHQGVMNDSAFALAVAHMHLLRHIADVGKIPEVGSKSLRMTLSEAAELLSAYVSQRVQPFPFPTNYYDTASTPMRTLWRYSEGLEWFYRQYCSSDVFSWKCCDSFSVDVGIVPQLSPQTMERIFQQTLERHEDTSQSDASGGTGGGYAARTARKQNSGITMDGFFELIARVAGSLYADDVFSKRITLEAKMEHLITTVLGAAYANLRGGALPAEVGDVPNPQVTKLEPNEVDESCTQVILQGDYFGALGRGLYMATSVSPVPIHITQKTLLENLDEFEGVAIPMNFNQSIKWDECFVIAPLPRMWNFIFKHHVTIVVGNTPEDVLHRAEPQSGLLTVVHSPMTFQLSSSTLETIESVFKDGCEQLAYNKGHMYDFCWEYVATQYYIGQMVSIANACALGIEVDGIRTMGSLSVSGILMALFRKYAKARDAPAAFQSTTKKETPSAAPPLSPSSSGPFSPSTTPQPQDASPPVARPSLTLHTFSEILCRMAMATGCDVDAAEDIIIDMLKPVSLTQKASSASSQAQGAQGRRGTATTVAGSPTSTDDPLGGPSARRGSMGTFLGNNERRQSDFSNFGDDGSESNGDYGGQFRGRSKSIKDNDTMIRTVVTEQRLVRALKQGNSDLKSKLSSFEERKRLWDITRSTVQSTMAQLRGLLEIVLPPETSDGGVHIASKLAVVYRKQLLDICQNVGDVMERDGGSNTEDGDAVKRMIQTQLDAFAAAEQRALHQQTNPHKGNRLQAQLAMMAGKGTNSPPPESAEMEELREEKAAVERALAEQEARVLDLRELLQRAHTDNEKAVKEGQWLRSILSQQKAQHHTELTKLRGAVSEKSEQVKTHEVERSKIEKTLASLEQQLHQKKLEVSRLEFLQQQQETSIESLSVKLSDTISRSVHGATHVSGVYGASSEERKESTAAPLDMQSTGVSDSIESHMQPSSSGGGGGVGGGGRSGSGGPPRRRSSTTGGGGSGAVSSGNSNKWAAKKMQANAASVNSSALLIKELEALRQKEKEFLKNRSATITEQLEQEATSHRETQQALSESKERNKALRSELEKMIGVVKVIGRVTVQQLQTTPQRKKRVSTAGGSGVGSGDDDNNSELEAVLRSVMSMFGEDDESASSSPWRVTDDDDTHGDVEERRVAAQLDVLRTIQATLGTSTTLVESDKAASSRDDARLLKRQADAERDRKQHEAEESEFGDFVDDIYGAPPVRQGSRATFVVGAPAPPSSSPSSRRWTSAVNKASAVVALQRLGGGGGTNAPGKSGGAHVTVVDDEGSPLSRAQSGVVGGLSSAASMRKTTSNVRAASSGAFGSIASAIGKGKSFVRNASGASMMSPSNGVVDGSDSPQQSQLQAPSRGGRAAPTLARCSNCANMRSILVAHHSYTRKCLDILRGDLENLRVRVALDLREGYDGLRERSELILRAAEYAPQILHNALHNAASGSQRSSSRNVSRAVSPTSPPIPSLLGHQQATMHALRGALAGTEILIPNGARQGAISPEDGASGATRMERLAKLLAALSPTSLLEDSTLSKDAPWRSNAALISEIHANSSLSVLKGVHVSRGWTPGHEGKHWLRDDDNDLPPSPFVVRDANNALVVIDQRLTRELDPSGVFVGSAPVADEAPKPPAGKLFVGHTPGAREAHALASEQQPASQLEIELEGAVKYKMIIRDKTTGDITITDAAIPPPPRTSGRGRTPSTAGGSLFPAIGAPRTPRTGEGGTHTALVAVDESSGDDLTVTTPRNRMNDLIQELLSDSVGRKSGGRRLVLSSSSNHNQDLVTTPLDPQKGLDGLGGLRRNPTSPGEVTTSSVVGGATMTMAQPSRLGAAAESVRFPKAGPPSAFVNGGNISSRVFAVSPPVVANSNKLNSVRRFIANDTSASTATGFSRVIV